MTINLRLAVASLFLLPSAAQSTQLPELLVLGSPHLANHNRDIVNLHVEDIRTPIRQREIATLIANLARFRPTKVAVEWPADQQEALDRRYADYRGGKYSLSADEIDQIGLRLAARLGLDRIDAVNWNDNPPGAVADYDFAAWAESHGRGSSWDIFRKTGQERADADSKLMSCTPISTWYRRLNDPIRRRLDQRRYYEIASFGDQAANPGSAWVGAWYARNLRILGNIRRLARPGDRILVLFGAGHGFLLDQQARESGAFEVAQTLSYLPTSTRDSWTACRS